MSSTASDNLTPSTSRDPALSSSGLLQAANWDAQRALLNILEDFCDEKLRLEVSQRAALNILDDFSEEKNKLQEAQRAALNILEDIDAEKIKVERAKQQLEIEVEERKRAEKDLARNVAQLKSSNDELQQFAYVASHDLQEPLRMVASYTQLLAKRYTGRLDADADEFIGYAVDGSNRMQRLIRDLLTYSRAGASGKASHPIPAENALKQALINLEATITESGATVTYDPLPAVATDESQLVQLFQNLIGNAIKYRGAETPCIHISATIGARKECVFSVRDNGIGIEPQQFDRIFVLFQRLHPRGKFAGTGIGLAICKKIVEKQGGRIWVESQLQKGSTFYFGLPYGGGK